MNQYAKRYFSFFGLLALFLTSFFVGAFLLKTHLWTGIALVSLGIAGVIWDAIALLAWEEEDLMEEVKGKKGGEE